MLSDIDRYFPLDLREPPGAFTPWRIRALGVSPNACARVLGRSGVAATAAPDRPLSNGCGYVDGVAASAASLALAAPPVMRCPLAAAYAAWERHVVQPAAQARFGARVVGVNHFGSYSCRNTYGRATGRRSQHATANALDVSGFQLSNGRTITVRSDWDDPGSAGRFLRDVRDGGCGLFGAVLSPDYNAAHHDHFHLDLGAYQVCR